MWQHSAQTPRCIFHQISLSAFSTRTRGNKTIQKKQDSMEASRKINSNIMSCGKKGDWVEIVEIHHRDRADFNAVNYSTAMNQLSKIKTVRRQHPRLESLVEGIAIHLQERPLEWPIRNKVMTLHAIAKMRLDFPVAVEATNSILQDAVVIVECGNPQDIANAAWAVATMRIESPQLFDAIDKDPACVIADGNAQGIANTAWAFATLGIQCPNLFKAIDKDPACVIAGGNAQDIANTSWAFASLKSDGVAFFRAVDGAASHLVKSGIAQAIANTAWAVATMRIETPQLFDAIDKDPACVIADGTAQTIANTAWAFATLGIECPNLFKAIDKDPACVIADGTAQAIANTAWAFATLKADGTTFFLAVDESAIRLVKQGTTQNIANTAWAFASQGMQAPSLCLQIEEHAASIVSRGDSQHISNIIWSLATLGVVCPQFCRAVDQDASRLIKNGDSQSVSNTLWAMSTLGFDAPSLVEVIRDRLPENHVRLCSNQNLLNICFALAISDSFAGHTDTFTMLWKQANERDWNELSYMDRNQLVQSYLIASCVYRLKLSPPKWASTPLTATVHKSKAQAELSKILEEIDFHHDTETSPFGSNNEFNFWSIDCACRDRKIAIEFDGPAHFLRLPGSHEPGDIENGPTKAKRRFLQSLGWKVINISYVEWRQAGTREGKRKLLAKRLKSVL